MCEIEYTIGESTYEASVCCSIANEIFTEEELLKVFLAYRTRMRL
jgi:hypothetical protein